MWAALLLGAWGYLAVLFTAVASRQTEVTRAGGRREPHLKFQSREIEATGELACAHAVSEASLIFKEHLERLSEPVFVLPVGGMLFLDSWRWRAVGPAYIKPLGTGFPDALQYYLT